MRLALYVWPSAVAILQLCAAAVEYNAIRQQVNGSNGLFLFTAGVLSLASLPLGGAVVWYLEGWRAALLGVVLVGIGAAALFYCLLKALDRLARAGGGRQPQPVSAQNRR